MTPDIAELIKEIAKKIETESPEPIEAIVISRRLHGFWKCDHEGKKYILAHPGDWAQVVTDPRITVPPSLPVYEDEELATKILASVLLTIRASRKESEC